MIHKLPLFSIFAAGKSFALNHVKMIFREIAKVVENYLIADNTYLANLSAPKIASSIKPGQFINILPSADWEKVMRRPMSAAGASNNCISIIYKAVGEGTKIMSGWAEGDVIDIIGPLGNSWEGFEKTPVLIGGGVGIAPIYFLHNELANRGVDHFLIMGARNSAEHFLTHSPADKILLTTDNGTLGIPGDVINGLNEIKKAVDIKDCKLFVCGPAPMMEALRLLAVEENIDCDIALETLMACGFGICQGCTMEYASASNQRNTYRQKFGLVCIDGPIFKAKDIKTCYL